MKRSIDPRWPHTSHLHFQITHDVNLASIAGELFLRRKQLTVSRKPQYKDVQRRTIEMPQRARMFKANCCFTVHNAHLKLSLPISR